jgi:hypothetical protein
LAEAIDPGQAGIEPTPPASEGEAPTSDGAEGQASEFDWASVEVDVAGRTMKAGDVVKSYGETEKRMRHLEDANLKADNQLKQYGWADDFRERYQNDPAFQQQVDAAWSNQQATQGAVAKPTYQPHVQELDGLKVQMQQMQNKAEIAEMRAKGMEISPQDEISILTEISTGRVSDPQAAYAVLFRERDIEAARRDSTANTAEHMRKGQTAYDAPPKGSQTTVKKSQSEMTPQEADDALLRDIGNMDMFKR